MERKEFSAARTDPEATSEAKRARARIRLGADSELLGLFGRSRESEDAGAIAEIDSGRQEIFAQGVFIQEELPEIDPDTPEVLAVSDHGDVVYPAFQFGPDGISLHPVAAEVNRIIKSPGDMHSWEQAFWWISNTGLLDGLTPLAVMEAGDFELLLEAARREMENPVD